MTPSDFARYSTLNYTTSKANHEAPLERYRIAIAAQLTTTLSELVSYLESIKMLGYESQIRMLNELCDDVATLREQIYQLINTGQNQEHL